jgi:hypothetical protein
VQWPSLSHVVDDETLCDPASTGSAMSRLMAASAATFMLSS